ncbi:MAG: aldose 1-epimerase family protein, partial [Acutalibacteraceae bacterium]|nr:aldose 1-epimerase family protein [Acutalibacteraceae bacterium]
MVTISNDRVTVQIAEYGAEMRRIVFEGVDYLWSGDEDVWSGTAPIMFPICGALVDNKYIYEGKEYTLPKHGFARHSMFTLENQGDNYAVFLLSSSDETLKMYPFSFEP